VPGQQQYRTASAALRVTQRATCRCA